MIRLIKLLIFGDFHLCKWEQVSERNVVEFSGGPVVGAEFIVKCEKCGRIKSFRV